MTEHGTEPDRRPARRRTPPYHRAGGVVGAIAGLAVWVVPILFDPRATWNPREEWWQYAISMAFVTTVLGVVPGLAVGMIVGVIAESLARRYEPEPPTED